MAKRYTDSLKWDDPFFAELSNEYKLLWVFILDKCNHAGIYKVNPKMAEFCLNTKYDWDKVLGVFKGRIQSLNPEKWFIPKFIEYQYGVLAESNRVHNSIIQILRKEGIYKDCLRTLEEAKDKEQDKVKDKDFIDTLKTNQAYKGIDIDRELGKMDAWLSMPQNRHRKKNQRFVLNWINKIDKPVEISKEKLNPVDPNCKNCRGDGQIYAPGSGKMAICECRKIN